MHHSQRMAQKLPSFFKPSFGSQRTAKQLIRDALTTQVRAIDHELCEPGEEDSFFVADLGEVYRQHMRWKKNLPRVRPFFAVKSNPDSMVLGLLAALGTGFDCASKTEIDQVLATGTSPDHIIYAQPCKTSSYIRHAKAINLRQMTFDNADELYKIARHFPEAELFIRIITNDTSSACRLSMKFGAPLHDTSRLLVLAKELGLGVVGISFHVGSGSTDPMAFYYAVKDAYHVFQEATNHGFRIHTLDVGGGFSTATFEATATVLNSALDEFFPACSKVEIIAEPGRYYVASAFTIACNVIARRSIKDPGTGVTSYMLYINDGVYGNFSNIIFDHQKPTAEILPHSNGSGHASSAVRPSTDIKYSVWGPTCDGIDRITECIQFSQVINIGDWLSFEEMGAYTMCSATQFNGFSNSHNVIYVSSEPNTKALVGI
ncbi:hypothetical protein NQ176_g6123 [Zarea fungicola]|uniref:Uncharacterized protein n=1 Tax=Zarea fungicola TaxID=93591 RepID=A0ACC1N4V9_9HYPO|nr:hypothetical protein NQ176_g6123 [Lecanicillium fungicola]